jgi:hypothetical protein
VNGEGVGKLENAMESEMREAASKSVRIEGKQRSEERHKQTKETPNGPGLQSAVNPTLVASLLPLLVLVHPIGIAKSLYFTPPMVATEVEVQPVSV